MSPAGRGRALGGHSGAPQRQADGEDRSTQHDERGDVAPDVAEVAGWMSPNPGGVGPMTRAMLLTNVVAAAERQL